MSVATSEGRAVRVSMDAVRRVDILAHRMGWSRAKAVDFMLCSFEDCGHVGQTGKFCGNCGLAVKP